MISLTPPTKRQQTSASNYLRVKTEFSTDFHVPISPERVLTPVSADSSHHQGSFASNNWAYTHTSGTNSHPSSVSSFQSHGPATPPYNDHQTSHLSLDLKSISHSTDIDQTYAETLFSSPMQTPGVSHEVQGLAVTTAPEWSGLGYRHNLTLSMPFNSYSHMDSLPSASTSFSSSMSGRSLPHMEDPNKAMTAYSGTSWPTNGLMDPIAMTSAGYRGSFMPSLSDSFHHVMPGNEQWPVQSHHMNVDSSTIIPSQTIVGGQALIIDHSAADLAFSSPGLHQYRDSASFSTVYDDDTYSDETGMRGEADGQHSDQSGSLYGSPSWSETRTGGKSVKKQKKVSTQPKKRVRGSTLGATYKGRVVKVPMEKTSASKRYSCCYPSENGQVCGKKFQRVEHLKRHRQTHDGTQYYYCPDPECEKVDRGFRCRNDNLREHFKTHLRETTTKRNSSRSFEEFYGFIRHSFTTEDAEKYISKLEKWRAEGGHLKAENATGRRSSNN